MLKRFLFIDDDAEWLARVEAAVRSNDVQYAVCTGFRKAMEAYSNQKPETVFLDHSLSGDSGDEGYEIAERLLERGVTVYSTTNNPYAAKRYAEMGIKVMPKQTTPLGAFRAIIEPERIAAGPA